MFEELVLLNFSFREETYNTDDQQEAANARYSLYDCKNVKFKTILLNVWGTCAFEFLL